MLEQGGSCNNPGMPKGERVAYYSLVWVMFTAAAMPTGTAEVLSYSSVIKPPHFASLHRLSQRRLCQTARTHTLGAGERYWDVIWMVPKVQS